MCPRRCRKTAKSFSVAGSFFDVMKQFGELDLDVRRGVVWFAEQRSANLAVSLACVPCRLLK